MITQKNHTDMNKREVMLEIEATMRLVLEVKNRMRRIASMLEPEEKLQPDLFTAMGLTKEPLEAKIERATQSFKGVDVEKYMADVRGIEPEEPETDIPWGPATVAREPQRRTWKRVGCRMKDEIIVAAEKVGRKNGWCQRSDIERSLRRRNPERSREDIRKAVNAAVKEMGLTCVKYNSYRFYRTADRGLIIASALARLTA